jgi:thiamine-phosphate pyrophosphorylase
MSFADYAVYLVTDAPERYGSMSLLQNVEAAVSGGVSVVQYRFTHGTGRQHYETARALRALLKPRGVPLIINDRVDLALAVDADGVHVGQGDLPVEVVRRMVGRQKLVGLSITARGQLTAIRAGEVDYLGVGPVYPTFSKSDAAPALGLDGFRDITLATDLPVVAIGGITTERAIELFAQGAAGVAVVSAFSFSAKPGEVARELKSAAQRRTG